MRCKGCLSQKYTLENSLPHSSFCMAQPAPRGARISPLAGFCATPPSPFKKILAGGGRIDDSAGWLEKVGEFCAGKLPREGKPGSVEEGQVVVCVRGEPRLGPCPVLSSWLLGV